jgi:hypothetical protein
MLCVAIGDVKTNLSLTSNRWLRRSDQLKTCEKSEVLTAVSGALVESLGAAAC